MCVLCVHECEEDAVSSLVGPLAASVCVFVVFGSFYMIGIYMCVGRVFSCVGPAYSKGLL